ncbi:RdgB/HAM1 family non-canonical purine NTP pyrophosphatase [Mediannikoviicoccus vaginalis]|uniref:RdgB/HAM1 family non-canonical purine NTP pyrophosphatase n=1 Tax=Mediannikoviicoccus vaginalis TaxID=2899727 RepID=UPI001F0127FC|nr:RdgB/HAM1 family non-canonical purine NTP pyrophosphatase [Mediannikoviicoccus vaginalis]
MKDLIVASHNRGKIEEIGEMLGHLGIKVIGVSDYISMDEVEENAPTLEGNAKIKAEFIYEKVKKATLADDTGLFVRALNNEPGVRTARYAGKNPTERDNRVKMLKEMEGKEDRFAFFETVLYLIDENGKGYSVSGICEGDISTEEMGTKGFGYDSIFIPKGEQKTFGQLSMEEKNKYSHRAKVLNKLNELLVRILDEDRNSK